MRPTIVVTQRVDELPDRNETRDGLDQALCRILQELNVVPVPIPNTISDAIEFVSAVQAHGVVFSGGNNLAATGSSAGVCPNRDAVENALLDWCVERSRPALGICRGMQLLCSHFGASLRPITDHVATRHPVRRVGTGLACYPAELNVNSFHSFAVSEIPAATQLEIVFEDSNGYAEAVVHRSLPLAGVMWHPEREDPFEPADIQLLRSTLCL